MNESNVKPAPVFRCTVCCAVKGEPHAPSCPGGSEDQWHAFVNPPALTVNTRNVGGVLCRWWGDGPAPEGVAMIDAAADSVILLSALEGQHKALDQLMARMIELDPDFRPTKWQGWPALVAASNAIKAARGQA